MLWQLNSGSSPHLLMLAAQLFPYYRDDDNKSQMLAHFPKAITSFSGNGWNCGNPVKETDESMLLSVVLDSLTR